MIVDDRNNNPFEDPRPPAYADPFADFNDEPQHQRLQSTSNLDFHNTTSYSNDALGMQPNASNSAAASTRTDDTAVKLAEVERREQELSRREQDLSQREQDFQRRRANGGKNWPFFYPLIYHDINDEIDSQNSRQIVWMLYRIWLMLLIVLIINMVAGIFLVASGQADGAKDMGASIMYLPVIGILSFLLWYRPIYNAFMKERAMYYYLYFLFGGFHIAFSIYMFIGIPSTGGAGIINTIRSFTDGSIATGVLCTVGTVGWALQVVSFTWYYRSIWRHKNEQGHSFDQAKSQFSEGGWVKSVLLSR